MQIKIGRELRPEQSYLRTWSFHTVFSKTQNSSKRPRWTQRTLCNNVENEIPLQQTRHSSRQQDSYSTPLLYCRLEPTRSVNTVGSGPLSVHSLRRRTCNTRVVYGTSPIGSRTCIPGSVSQRRQEQENLVGRLQGL